MSAFVHSKAHIDALVTLVLAGPNGIRPTDWYSPTELTPDQIGQMLWAENVASVNARYEEANPAETYTYTPGQRLKVIEGLKAVLSYEYQSCEHDGWDTSKAFRLMNAVKDRLINRLPGFGDAYGWSL